MKSRLRHLADEAWPLLKRTSLRYPVELGMALYAFVCYVLFREEVLTDTGMERAVWAVPLLTAAAYVVNTLTRNRPAGRKFYCAVPLLLPFAVWAGHAWLSTSQYVIACWILSPLAVLLCRRARENVRFTQIAICYLAAYGTALLLSGIFFLAVEAIYASVSYIFGIWKEAHETVWAYDTGVSFLLLAPTLFFALIDYFDRGDRRFNRLGSGILNYLFTPALLIYTAILYLYAAKILCVWELPKGGVAYMVLGYMVVLTATKALQGLSEGSRFNGFFDRYSYLTLAPLGLFWFGTLRRIGEYGLTDWRVYLIVCGGICTAAALLFLRPRTGRYHYVAALSFALFFLVAFLPPLTADRIAIRSQSRRAERIARERGMLLPDGTLDLAPRTEADSVFVADYHQLGEALEYLSDNDSTALARFGIGKLRAYYEIFPHSYADRVRYDYRIYYDEEIVEVVEADIMLSADTDTQIVVGPYGSLCPKVDRNDRGDTLVLRFGGREVAIDRSALLAAQMERAGLKWEEEPSEEDFQREKARLLLYETDSLGIVFRSLSIDPREHRITSLFVDCVLVP